MSENPKTSSVVLVIDDSPEDREMYRRFLMHGQDDAFDVVVAESGAIGIEQLKHCRPDCVLLDYNLPDMDGVEVLGELQALMDGDSTVPVIILTGMGNERVAVEAMKAGAREYLIKGQLTAMELRSAVANAMETASLQRELQRAYATLEKKNQRLSDLADTAHRFVDDVAHEFRTPLAVIQEFTAIINDGIGGPVNDRQRDFLNYIASATHDLTHLVDDFLDSSQLKHRSLRVDRKPHVVSELFDSTRSTLETRARHKEIVVVHSVEPNLPTVFCDLEKAGRTLINLAVNAIKFSPNGSTVKLSAVKSESGGVLIQVTDEGPGIPAEELAQIAQRFGQGESGMSGKVKGFGLGLNIAAGLIRLNMGRLNVSCPTDGGSQFEFTLPANDLESLVDRYPQTMAACGSSAAITVLHVTPIDQSTELESLRSWLASACYAMDLVIPCKDERSVLLIGATAEADNWVVRLGKASHRFKSDEEMPHPVIRAIGTWSGDLMETMLKSHVAPFLKEVRACA